MMVLQELNKPFQGKSTQNCFKISVSLFTWRIHCNQCHQPNLALNIAPCFPLLKLVKKMKFSLFSAYISYKRETIKRKATLNFTYVQFFVFLSCFLPETKTSFNAACEQDLFVHICSVIYTFKKTKGRVGDGCLRGGVGWSNGLLFILHLTINTIMFVE